MAGYNRSVAVRMFSDDLQRSVAIEREDEEFAPQYVRTKSGAKANRIFFCGTLLDCEDFGQDAPFWRIKISDPKGIFNCNIGQYSPIHAQTSVETLEVPCFVAVVGKIKPREYEESTYFDVAIESITPINVETYDMWCKETEEHTASRYAEPTSR